MQLLTFWMITQGPQRASTIAKWNHQAKAAFLGWELLEASSNSRGQCSFTVNNVSTTTCAQEMSSCGRSWQNTSRITHKLAKCYLSIQLLHMMVPIQFQNQQKCCIRNLHTQMLFWAQAVSTEFHSIWTRRDSLLCFFMHRNLCRILLYTGKKESCVEQSCI